MARRTRSKRDRRKRVTPVREAPALISQGHRGVPCNGDPAVEVMNTCPSPATRCLVTPGLVGSVGGRHDAAELGWIILTFCDRHKQPVLDFMRPRVGPFGDEAIVAEIAALPTLLREVVGIDAAIEGLDENVITNVFLPRRVG